MSTDSGNFIQQLKDKLNIEDIVGSYVSLQKKGRDYWACCPFHHEKTPSFQIKPLHQIYRCYGCGKQGDIINFVMEMDKISFGDALEKLAKQAGLEMPERTVDIKYKKQKELLEKIYAVNRESALFYHNNLKTTEGEIALNYLAGRELKKETIIKFGIGYSCDYTSLVDYLKKKGYSIETMQEAGVIGVTEDGRAYDFFAKRLIIPIINANGKVIGFTGRSLEKKPDHAKYKNTSTTLAFNKRKNLFGVNMYKQYVPAGNRAMILVEGHMDVISLFQAGIYNVVASMGTALTPEQCKEIKRFADVVYVSYDGDSAGQNATLKGLSLLKNEGLEVKVVQLTDNLDPDDYVKKFGKEGYLQLVDQAIPLVDFRLKKIEEKYSLKNFDEKTKYVREAVGVLNELDEVEKAVYAEKISQISGLSMDRIDSALQVEKNSVTEQRTRSNEDSSGKTEKKQGEDAAFVTAENFLLSAMIFGKSYAHFGDAQKEFFESEAHQKVFDYINDCAHESQRPTAGRLYDICEKEDADAIINATDNVSPESQASFYTQCTQKLFRRSVEKELKKAASELNTETNEERKNELKRRIIELTKLKK